MKNKENKDMSLPLPLLKITYDISGDLPDDERKEFIEAITTASKKKDLSTVHWRFLGAKLRALPERQPKQVQTVVNRVIAGIDRLAAGRAWPDAIKVAKIAKAVADAADTAVAADYTDYAVADTAADASYVATCAANVAILAANEADTEARQRQRDILLALIQNAKQKKG